MVLAQNDAGGRAGGGQSVLTSVGVGRRQPFDAAVRDHGGTVLRVCRAVLGARFADDVDDAWSETFLAALAAWPALPADANVEAWLVTIANRKAIDVTRRAATRGIPMAEIPDVATDFAGSAAHLGGLDLAAAVAALPRRQRDAVTYHYLAGLPYAVVAEVVGSRPDAVRRASSDGLKALRTKHIHLITHDDEERS